MSMIFVVLRGLKQRNVFWTMCEETFDPTTLATGEVAYEVLATSTDEDEIKREYEKYTDKNSYENYIRNVVQKLRAGGAAEPKQTLPELTPAAQVQVCVRHLPSLQVGSNPFHHDHWRMGTTLVRGWTVMHEGFDREEDQRPLSHLVLYNARSGQRIMLEFMPLYEYKNEALDGAWKILGIDVVNSKSGELESFDSKEKADEALSTMRLYKHQFQQLSIRQRSSHHA